MDRIFSPPYPNNIYTPENRMTPIEFRRANSSSPDDQIKATDNMNSEFVSDKKDWLFSKGLYYKTYIFPSFPAATFPK